MILLLKKNSPSYLQVMYDASKIRKYDLNPFRIFIIAKMKKDLTSKTLILS